MTANEAMGELLKIKYQLKAGFDYTECKNNAEQYLEIINKRSVELAKKYGVRSKLISFASFVR